ncbi:glycosyltransferase family 1 protein [Oceanobacillus neutriphilus]|uniref:Glycosyltransferase EpsF n=1 Tax=Oceanobacillus neutriphilus TaxID=531815 RepID=A0ABQ2NZ28_9BACI|nr:glycosyltransferase family 1 protein [Oceanobacillus neutriphilus]GGP14056.1 putative glycosyltransferase EpsF [Oceanobacillus neutriphilus]
MGSPLRVLHAVVNMNRGGAETLIMNLYRNINREKVQFDFLTCKEGLFDKEIEAMGGKIYRIPYLTEAGHFGYLRALNTFFTEHKAYKIIHSHMDKMSGFVIRAAKKAGVPVRIAHSHNTQSEGHLFTKMYKWYAGTFIKQNATHLYACSQAAAEWMFMSEAKQTFILNNGVEIDKFKYSNGKGSLLRDTFGIAEEAFVLGHVGRFHEQKNHKFIINLFHNLNQEMRDLHLVLVGDGPSKKEMERRVSELKLDKKIKFLGVRDDIPDLLQMFDLFIFPSFFEGLPVTLVEAQASGLPCIISDSITEEVDMNLGLIHQLSISDKDLWIKKIMELKKELPSREVEKEHLITKGFDIKHTAASLQTKYLTVGEM